MTLTELLVALALVSLISLALAVGVSSAAKVYRSATRLYEAETLCGTILTCLEDEYRFARNIQADGSFDSQTYGNGVKAYLNGEGQVYIGSSGTPPAAPGTPETPVALAEPVTPGMPDPYALDSALISGGAYTSELKVTKLEIILHDGGGTGGGSGVKKISAEITVGVKAGSGDDGANVEHTVTVACLNHQ